ncbi:hypothetical protein EJ04DRAFT_582514 [Polyplosphaeria fusca]|uniref:Zn(2)-C6 fungal-type domain-containing protein n=1 Tax=Polyplosphaeria fusca TaxID=682080 RepID=A0A9P4QG96_9PLEO|nr:hypothetical protein EJ04DRAFT_582514 [Polyplosphaeria fusca]
MGEPFAVCTPAPSSSIGSPLVAQVQHVPRLPAGSAQNYRIIAPKPSKDVKWQPCKKAKSRNGCLTCKAKRMKCDETKPSCHQCARRGHACGGYKIDFKWKPCDPSKSTFDGQFRDFLSICSDPAADPTRSTSVDSSFLEHYTSAAFAESVLNHSHGMDYVSNDSSMILGYSSNSFEESQHFDACLLNLSEHLFSSSPDEEISPNPQPADHVFNANPARASSNEVADPDDIAWADLIFGFDETFPAPLQIDQQNLFQSTTPLSPLSGDTNRTDGYLDWIILFQQPHFQNDSPEVISLIFNNYTCNILSIKDRIHGNPWTYHVWMMAKTFPALYQALAAMACLHVSKVQPELRAKGIQHIQLSKQELEAHSSDGVVPLDQFIATTLALGFAETWDCQQRSTASFRVSVAKELFQRAYSSDYILDATAEDVTRLRFLARTCLYMDVISRLTANGASKTLEDDFTSAAYMHSYPLAFPKYDIDPLMGYATELFPLIGQVADLVYLVRNRTANRNSPAIISRAADLKQRLERWSVLVDDSTIKELSTTQSDALQTAEAYRWASLLLLRQAVPELPSVISYPELAQKVMIYLATTSHVSRTIIIQIFPLMMAGCEAIEDEDRDWVRQRWSLMARNMVTGIVDRCFEITTEVWHRRDRYAKLNDICPSTGATIHSPPRPPVNVENSNSHTSTTMTPNSISTSRNDFPVSAAFKNGVDLLTKSGCIDYSVKGKLHWLGVMKDWNCEVMLG